MHLALVGLIGLFIGVLATAASIVALLIGGMLNAQQARRTRSNAAATNELIKTFQFGGHLAQLLSALCLTFCVGLLIFCFLSGDNTLEYVAQNRSYSDSALHWLYLVSGLWSGRSGSLLFWAWLIAVFNSLVALRNLRKLAALDSAALAVSQTVLLAFLAVMVFSAANMPFTPTDGAYLTADGQLTGTAVLWGLNPLLEHWAMAIHPPTLFLGYAGLTIPFSYALAALIVKDDSRHWVDQSNRFALAAWLFLGMGIGLGAIWAYVVLGWGGYWGWDAVENASLLSWLLALALVHSFTVYRQHGTGKRWTVLVACLCFSFVIVGTFITRSGIVNSVHAFEQDPVSLALFGVLIIASILAGAFGLLWRRQNFQPRAGAESDRLISKDTAYFFNNAVMLIVVIVITYLTLAPALPTWLPWGGQSIQPVTYNAIARPLGVIYCLVMAVCPLLAWGRNDWPGFWKKARLALAPALLLFIALMVYFGLYLVPTYDGIIAQGGSFATALSQSGPRLYYFGLTILGFLVASLLFFNSLILLGRVVQGRARSHNQSILTALVQSLHRQSSLFGGFLAHLGIAIVLVGLIGSSMYNSEVTGYLTAQANATTTSELVIQDYTLRYLSDDITVSRDGRTINYSVTLAVYRHDQLLGEVSPNIDLIQMTQETRLNAATLHFLFEDLFVVYNGVNNNGDFALDVRVNPLINLVWLGFGVLMLGTLIAVVGRRRAAEPAARTPESWSTASAAASPAVIPAPAPAVEDVPPATDNSAPPDRDD